MSIDDLLLGLVPDGLPPTGSGDGVLGSSWELSAGESLESDLDLDGAGGLDLNEVGSWGRGDAADLDEVERDDGSLAVTDLEDTELVGIGVKGSVPGQDGGRLLGVGVADGDFELAWLAGAADTFDGLDGDTEGRTGDGLSSNQVGEEEAEAKCNKGKLDGAGEDRHLDEAGDFFFLLEAEVSRKICFVLGVFWLRLVGSGVLVALSG